MLRRLTSLVPQSVTELAYVQKHKQGKPHSVLSDLNAYSFSSWKLYFWDARKNANGEIRVGVYNTVVSALLLEEKKKKLFDF